MSNQKLYKRILQGLFFLALIAPLLVDRKLFFPYVTSSALFFRLIVEILLGLWIIFILVYSDYRPKKNLMLGVVLFYIIALILSTIFSANPYLSFWGDAERMMGLFAILHFFALYLVGISIFQEKKELWLMINSYVLVSFIAAGYGILQRYGFTSIKPNELRIVSTMGNAGTFAGYLIFGLFLSGYLACASSKKYWRAIYWVSVFIHLIALFFTGTRGAYLGAGIGALTAFFIIVFKLENKPPHLDCSALDHGASGNPAAETAGYHHQYIGVAAGHSRCGGKKLKCSALAAIGILLACYIFLLFNPKLAEVNQYTYRLTHFSLNDSTLQTRILAWKWGFKGFLDKPVLGYGLENYAVPYNKYFEAKYYNLSPEEYFDRAHNIVIELLSTCGLVGLLSYLFLFGVMIFYIRNAYKKDHDFYYFGIILGLIIAYFVQNLFIFDLLPNMIGFMVLLVIVSNYRNSNIHPVEINATSPNPSLPMRGNSLKNSVSRPLIIAPLSLILFSALLYSYQILIKKPYQALKDDVSGQVLLPYKYEEGMRYLKRSVNYHTFLDLDLRSSAANTIHNYYQENGIERDSKKDDINFAINLYKENLKYLPNDTYYNFKIADILNYRFSLDPDEKFLPETRAYIDKAIETSPKRTRVYFRMSDHLLMAGKLDEAAANAEKALGINDKFGEAQWELTKIYYLTNRYDKAKKSLIKTVDLGYHLSDDNLKRMMHLFEIGASKENAIKYYELVIKNGTSNYLYYTTLANLYYETGNKEQAIKYATQAFKVNPEIKDQIEGFINEIEKE